MAVQWDEPGNQFVYGLDRNGSPPVIVSAPYGLSDTTAPFDPTKQLIVRTFAEGCVDGSSVAAMEARFPDVHVNQEALP